MSAYVMASRPRSRALRLLFDPLDALSRWRTRRLTVLRQDLALATRFRPRADDVYLVGYPRSGLALLQMALYQLTTDGAMPFPHIAAVSPTLEAEVVAGDRFVEKLPSPRIFKSHLPYARLPRGGRTIYLLRDVGDVAVSAHRYCSLLAGRELDRDEFLAGFLAGHPRLGGSWFDHLRSWWPHRQDEDVLFLDYDEVVADLAAALLRIARFCGLDLAPGTLERALDACRFDSMLQHEARFDPRLRQISGPAESFIRKGVAGGGKLEISARQRAEMGRRTAALARRLGCRPGDPFAALFEVG